MTKYDVYLLVGLVVVLLLAGLAGQGTWLHYFVLGSYPVMTYFIGRFEERSNIAKLLDSKIKQMEEK